jgi:hypothetical protein
LNGCSALQYARYHTPSVADDSIKTAPVGDGIAFRLPDVCVGISEGLSAYRNPLFVGPLVFTVFPLGIVSPFAKDSNYLWLDLQIKPNAESFRFIPSKVHTTFSDGSVLSPAAYMVWHLYTPPGPIRFIGATSPDPIEISIRTSIVSLRFDKSNSTDQAASVLVEGLFQDGRIVQIPRINLKLGSDLRMIFPGHFSDNTTLDTFNNGCALLNATNP